MNIQAITTCHFGGWKLYGRRMATSWAKHWPVPLTVWTEGFSFDQLGLSQTDIAAVQWLTDFKKRRPYRLKGKYNFRLDAPRFAHKTAAVIETAAAMNEGHLIWVDADTVTHAPVPLGFVDALLPQADEYIAWLDRETSYPECGFYVLNCAHPMHQQLIAAWRELYTSDALFKLPEWHDSFVLQHLVENVFGLPRRSLSGEARATSHPFINGPLGAYMDHMKGDARKRLGRSHSYDLKQPRTETYWRTSR